MCPLIWFTCVKSGKAEVEELKQLQAAAKAKSEAATPGALCQPGGLCRAAGRGRRPAGGHAAGSCRASRSAAAGGRPSAPSCVANDKRIFVGGCSLCKGKWCLRNLKCLPVPVAGLTAITRGH